MADIIIINHKTGEQARAIGRAWWTDGALEVEPGRIEVARIHAESTTQRNASDDDIASGRAYRYQSGPDMTGSPCQYMIGLTEDDLAQYGIKPGVLQWPDVVDGARPKNNRVDHPATLAQYQRAMDRLQNEGY